MKENKRGRVLITGGAGFIGTHTAWALLERGCFVRVLDILDPQIHGSSCVRPAALDPRAEFMRGDIRRPEDLRRALCGVDAVFHFASLTGVGQSMYDLRNYTDVNVSGTAALLEIIAKEKIPLKKFILASSRAVYGEGSAFCQTCGPLYPSLRRNEDLAKGIFEPSCPSCGGKINPLPTREARPLHPASLYGWTKRAQEDLCLQAAASGLPLTILRYFNVYGSGQSLTNPYTGIVSIFYSRLMAGQPISLYERGLPLRDFVHVSDVVRANILALETPLPKATVLNVGSGSAVTVAELASALAGTCGKKPEFLDRGEYRAGDIFSCSADISESKRLLGYETLVSLEDGLAEFVSWAGGKETADLYERAAEELRSHGFFGQAAMKEGV